MMHLLWQALLTELKPQKNNQWSTTIASQVLMHVSELSYQYFMCWFDQLMNVYDRPQVQSSALITEFQSSLCKVVCMINAYFTLRGNGVLRAWWCSRLSAVSTGVLKWVPAALLLLHAEAASEHHGQVTGCWRHFLTMLEYKINTQNKNCEYALFIIIIIF